MIEARSLSLSLGGNMLLRELSLGIAAGECVALVGHNGAGKSTLLRAISGFCAVVHGSLRVQGTELCGLRSRSGLRRLRAQIAQVHQGLHLVERLSVLDNVLIGAAARHPSPLSWLRRWPRQEHTAAHAALARVGMDWAAARRVDSLSGGERQKVAIARALQQDAPLLLADEPTASLDARAAADIIDLLGAVARERGATLVCVLHDLELVPRIASRVVALRRGSVVADARVTPESPRMLREVLH